MKAEDLVFRALADPRRRRLLDALLLRDQTVSELCALFPISQPAVSQHLKVLRESGLVRESYWGRQRIYRVELDALLPVSAWLERYESERLAPLEALAGYLRRAPKG